jgi:hypothetical protein
LEEGFHCDDFVPPDWRKVSIAMILFLQIGGALSERIFERIRFDVIDK